MQDGTLTPYKKSQPIPETNDMPIKIVVGESFSDIVFESGKNGTLLGPYTKKLHDTRSH